MERNDQEVVPIPSSQGAMAVPSEEKDQATSAERTPTASSEPPPCPDGGYGWICTICVGTINAHSWGLNSSYGVFLAHYLANDTYPGASHLEYAFVGSLSFSCALLVSPLATMCVRIYGTRPTMAIGVLLEAGSLIAASFATRIWHLFLTQGLMFGLGMGFLFIPSVAIVPQWFSRKRSLANGFSAAGSGLGGLLYSFASGAMIKNIGLEWAFRILGLLALVVNTVCTLLIRDRNRVIGSSQIAFDTTLLKRPEYLLLVGFAWFSMLAYVVLVFSLANYANEIGLNASQASLISAFFNGGQAVGRPLVGFFSDRTGRINMSAFMTFVAATTVLAIWIPADTYGVLILYSLVGGMVGGTFWATIGPVTAEVVGLKHVPSALSILWLSIVLPCTFSEPIALEIVQATGGYLVTQLWVGIMFLGGVVCMVFLRGWKVGETTAVESMTAAQNGGLVEDETNETVSIKSKKVGRRRMLRDCYKKAKV